VTAIKEEPELAVILGASLLRRIAGCPKIRGSDVDQVVPVNRGYGFGFVAD
jgi:hypothetical protein